MENQNNNIHSNNQTQIFRFLPVNADSWPNKTLPNETCIFKYSIGTDKDLLIGRNQLKENAQIDEKKLSRRQLLVTFDEQSNSLMLETNGINLSRVNGKNLEKEKKVPANVGDVVELLPNMFCFKIETQSNPHPKRKIQDEDSTQEDEQLIEKVSTKKQKTESTDANNDNTKPTEHPSTPPAHQLPSTPENLAKEPADITPLVQNIVKNPTTQPKEESNTMDEGKGKKKNQ